MTFSGYKIHHLDLSTDVGPVHDASEPAHYCVFWYQSLPLAEASVIIPCLSFGRFVGEAIESVQKQDHTNVETIVIDDGSTDNTRELAILYRMGLPEFRKDFLFQHDPSYRVTIAALAVKALYV